MDRIQSQMLENLNDFISRMKKQLDQEDGGYNEEHSTWMWTLYSLKDELLMHNEPPLVIIERFQNKLKRYSLENEIFKPCIKIIDMFLCSVL